MLRAIEGLDRNVEYEAVFRKEAPSLRRALGAGRKIFWPKDFWIRTYRVGRHRDTKEEGTGEVNEEAIREKDAVAAVGPEGGELWFGGLPDAQQSRGDDTGEASHINMQKESEDVKP